MAWVEDLNNTAQATGDGSTGLHNLALGWRIPIRAPLDLVPGSATNAIKLGGGGIVSVAILGSLWFQAADVDPASLRLGNDDGLDTPVAGRSSGLFVKLTDENHDGFPDRLAEFDKREMVRNGNLAAGTPTMVLLGRLKNGTAIRAPTWRRSRRRNSRTTANSGTEAGVRKAKRPEVRLRALAVNAELRVSTSRPCRRREARLVPASLPSSPPPRTRW